MTAIQTLIPTTVSDLVASSRSGSLDRYASSPPPERGLLVIGAHGGAGATTVTRLLDLDRTGHAIEDHDVSAPYPVDRRPVLVARSTASGIGAAAHVLARWHPIPPPVLVIVGDAPSRDPLAVTYRLRALEGQVAGVVRVPYIHALRAFDDPLDALKLRHVAKIPANLQGQLARVP